MSDKKTNTQTIDEFLNRKQLINRSSKETISIATLDSYKNILEQFSESLQKSFKQATEKDILHHLQHGGKKHQGYKPKSQNDIIIILRNFYRWLYDLEEEDTLPDCVRKLKPRRIEINEIKYREKIISDEEYNLIIENCEKPQHRAIIEALWCIGSRKAGIQNLRVGDVTYDGEFTRFIIRTDKTEPREIVYQGRCEHLLKWKESLCPNRNNPSAPLFVTTWGGHGDYHQVTKGYAWDTLKRICKRAGIERAITPHMFRHTVASKMLRDTPTTMVCSHMGWKKDTKMLKVYDHNGTKEYEEFLKKGKRNLKPTYDLLAKQKEELESKHEKQLQMMSEELKKLAEKVSVLTSGKMLSVDDIKKT